MSDPLPIRPPRPIDVAALFPELHRRLIDLLAGLDEEEWNRPTICTGWTVKDVALHMLGVDLGNLSTLRDEFADPWWAAASGDTTAALNREELARINSGNLSSPPPAAPMPEGPPPPPAQPSSGSSKYLPTGGPKIQ